MSPELHLILNVAMAVAIALVGGLVAHRLGQSVIVGYLLAGVAIGPFTPGFVGDQEQIAGLAEVGVIFLMFALGIEFSLKELARVRGVAVLGTTIQVLLMLAAGLGLGTLLGWPWERGLFLGGIISISSTMVILKALLDRGEVASNHGRVLLGMLIVQDLAVVLLIVLLPRLAAGSSTVVADLALTVLIAGAYIAATLFLGARVVPRLMARVEALGSPELFLLTAVAIALGSAAASAVLGLSPALGAFLGGLLLTETEFDHRVVAEVVPMRNLFATLFFVSVGMLIDPLFIAANLAAIIGLATFIVIAKIVATLAGVLPFRLGTKSTVFATLGMVQIGEFSYLLARAGRTSGAISEPLYNLILASSVLTIVLTPAAFWLAPRLDRRLSRIPAVQRFFAPRGAMVDEVEGLANHVVLIGYGRVGRHVASGLLERGERLAVVETDLHLVQELGRRGIPAVYGDASHEVIIAATHPERARLVVVAVADAGSTRAAVAAARRAGPEVPILVRAPRLEDEDELIRAGATGVIAPELAGALLLLEESERILETPGPEGGAATVGAEVARTTSSLVPLAQDIDRGG